MTLLQPKGCVVPILAGPLQTLGLCLQPIFSNGRDSVPSCLFGITGITDICTLLGPAGEVVSGLLDTAAVPQSWGTML